MLAVSSPHRYCQNELRAEVERFSERVSSPHRYCQNWVSTPHHTSVGMFQALIGTAKTRTVTSATAEPSLVSSPHRYCQNLRRSRSWRRSERAAFQALIGTAKTARTLLAEWEFCEVSSPHRYCQNKKSRSGSLSQRPVSSPHRYCQNAGPPRRHRSSHHVSSPHRYCQNPGTFSLLCRTRRVSSPHRYCQNAPFATSEALRSVFQALIGTAKTVGVRRDSKCVHGFKPS